MPRRTSRASCCRNPGRPALGTIWVRTPEGRGGSWTATTNRLDVAGRCVEGKLKGWTLRPTDAVKVKWFAWAAENPTTRSDLLAERRRPRAGQEGLPPRRPEGGDQGGGRHRRVPAPLPKQFATVKAIDPKARTVTLLLDGETDHGPGRSARTPRSRWRLVGPAGAASSPATACGPGSSSTGRRTRSAWSCSPTRRARRPARHPRPKTGRRHDRRSTEAQRKWLRQALGRGRAARHADVRPRVQRRAGSDARPRGDALGPVAGRRGQGATGGRPADQGRGEGRRAVAGADAWSGWSSAAWTSRS